MLIDFGCRKPGLQGNIIAELEFHRQLNDDQSIIHPILLILNFCYLTGKDGIRDLTSLPDPANYKKSDVIVTR
jgi:hypothetical protein